MAPRQLGSRDLLCRMPHCTKAASKRICILCSVRCTEAALEAHHKQRWFVGLHIRHGIVVLTQPLWGCEQSSHAIGRHQVSGNSRLQHKRNVTQAVYHGVCDASSTALQSSVLTLHCCPVTAHMLWMHYLPASCHHSPNDLNRLVLTHRGPFSRYNRIPYAPVIEQTVWDMTDPNDPNFPTNSTNQPNLDYYYPYGGLITQMIVLQAKNPYGDSFGTVAAAIFRYHANTTGYGFAVCGNARYANAYLRPLSSPPPPTVPMLQSQFVNPLSATNPGLFLAKFSGVCSTRGYGYLGGDPQTQSIYHVKYFTDPCFAAREWLAVLWASTSRLATAGTAEHTTYHQRSDCADLSFVTTCHNPKGIFG